MAHRCSTRACVSSLQFAVFYQSHVAFYDGATRALLREFDLDGPVTAIREIRDIHNLLIAAGGRLLVVDGVSGAVLAASDFLRQRARCREPESAAYPTGDTSFLVGAGSDVGVFRFNVTVSSKRSSRTASTADVPGRRRSAPATRYDTRR